MTQHSLEQLLQRAARLTPSERLLLASRLIQGVRNEMPSRHPQRKWKDAEGMLSYPALGEDAQSYISRSRHEDDNHRYLSIRDGE
jgi:hypothetical protein